MSATCPDGQVVHTPPVKEREGLLGYVLRVSEANGYSTPWHILSLAGISPGKMTTSTPPIEKLSSIIGRPIEELARLPWNRYPNGAPVAALNERRPQLARHLLLKHPKICPQCIAENGVTDAAWDLRIMLVCPKHRIAMVDRCPACHGRLTWFRPGLDRCRCGYRLVAQVQSSFPQHTIDLLQVVYDTLYGLPTHPTSSSGIPIDDLQRMGAEDLLQLLSKLDYTIAGTISGGKHAPNELDRLACLSDMFANWPRKFHQFLRAIDPVPDQATVGLSRRFESFYDNTMKTKTIPKEKMLFFRKAFGEYGSYDGVTPGADPRFFLTPAKWQALREQGLSNSQIRLQIGNGRGPRDAVNQRELALHLGVRPITARRWAEQGLFGLEHGGALIGGQRAYRTPTALPCKVTVGSWDVRKAARYLAIPVSVLVRLRRDGYYRVEHVGRYLAQFSQHDLDTLRNDILARAPKMLSTLPEGYVTLKAFFRMKLHCVDSKYQIVRSILDGNLVAAGRQGETIGDVVIADGPINALRDDMTVNDAIPAWRAAKALQCDQSICGVLVAQGKLQGTYRGRNLYVTTDSIESFRMQYVSCVSIARGLGCGIRRVLHLLSGKGIDLLRVKRTYRTNETEQTFCPREQAEKLFGCIAAPGDSSSTGLGKAPLPP